MTSMPYDSIDRERFVQRALFGALHTAWWLVRLPILAVLIVMEPIVCSLLGILSALGILGAVFFKFLVKDPRFPFWGTLVLSVALALAAGVYCALARLLGGSDKQ